MWGLLYVVEDSLGFVHWMAGTVGGCVLPEMRSGGKLGERRCSEGGRNSTEKRDIWNRCVPRLTAPSALSHSGISHKFLASTSRNVFGVHSVDMVESKHIIESEQP